MLSDGVLATCLSKCTQNLNVLILQWHSSQRVKPKAEMLLNFHGCLEVSCFANAVVMVKASALNETSSKYHFSYSGLFLLVYLKYILLMAQPIQLKGPIEGLGVLEGHERERMQRISLFLSTAFLQFRRATWHMCVRDIGAAAANQQVLIFSKTKTRPRAGMDGGHLSPPNCPTWTTQGIRPLF
jgi:hypothetical protein